MAVAIQKTIEVQGLGGASFGYWRLFDLAVSLQNSVVYATLVPWLNSGSTAKVAARKYAKTYELTFAQAGVTANANTLGSVVVGNHLRDTILTHLLNNESDFTGGSLV